MKQGLILMLVFSLLGHIAAAGMVYVAGSYGVWNKHQHNGVDDQIGEMVRALWIVNEDPPLPFQGRDGVGMGSSDETFMKQNLPKDHEDVILAQAGTHVGEGFKPSPAQTARGLDSHISGNDGDEEENGPVVSSGDLSMSPELTKNHENIIDAQAGNPGRGGFETLPYTGGRDLDNDSSGNEEHGEESSDKSGGDCISATACTASNVSTSSGYANTGQVVKSGEGDSGAGLKTFLEALRVEIERHKTYPPFARKNGIEGTTYLNFHIGENGRPDGIIIERSSGSKVLDESAIRTLKNMEHIHSVPEEIRELEITVPIAYRLVEDNTPPSP